MTRAATISVVGCVVIYLSMSSEWAAMKGLSRRLHGQDQLVVFGDAEPLGFALVVDQDFLAPPEQQACRDRA